MRNCSSWVGKVTKVLDLSASESSSSYTVQEHTDTAHAVNNRVTCNTFPSRSEPADMVGRLLDVVATDDTYDTYHRVELGEAVLHQEVQEVEADDGGLKLGLGQRNAELPQTGQKARQGRIASHMSDSNRIPSWQYERPTCGPGSRAAAGPCGAGRPSSCCCGPRAPASQTGRLPFPAHPLHTNTSRTAASFVSSCAVEGG